MNHSCFVTMSMRTRRDGKHFPVLKFAPYQYVKREEKRVNGLVTQTSDGRRRGRLIPLEGKDDGDYIIKPDGTHVKKLTGWVAESCNENGPVQIYDVYEAKEPKKEKIEWVDEYDKPPPLPWTEDAPPCPIHKEYGMVVKDIQTKYGPARLHKCLHPECIISCFGTDEERDHFLFQVDRGLHWQYRDKHCPLVCFCGNLLSLKMSRSEKNPDRLFLSCRCRDGGCKMFMWGDDKASTGVTDHWDWWMSK